MSTTVKVVIGVIVFVVLAAGATCAGAVWWFDSNKEKLREQGEAVKVEAETFAQATDEAGCLNRALEKGDECDGGPLGGAMCRALAGVFLDRCLPKARRTEGFCDGAPAGDDASKIMEMVTWSIGKCETLGRAGDQECGRLMNRLPPYCVTR